MCNVPANHIWSFSQLSLADHCMMAFKLKYIDHVPSEGNAFSDYGTFCHSLFEDWAKERAPAYMLGSIYEADYDDHVEHPFPPFPKDMAGKYFQAGKDYFDNFDGFGDQYEILSVEEKFTVEIAGYTFTGLADLVLKNKETGEIEVIDHKSKSKNSMDKEINIYRRQLYIYAAFVHQKYGVWPKRLRFNMFKEGYFIDEDFSMDSMHETEQWIRDTIQRILDEKDWLVSPSS